VTGQDDCQSDNFTLDLESVSIATLDAATNISTNSFVWYRVNANAVQALAVEANVTNGGTLQITLTKNCATVGGNNNLACTINTAPEDCRRALFTGVTVDSPYYVRFSAAQGITVNFTARVTRGNTLCPEIRDNNTALNFCKGFLPTGRYSVADVAATDLLASQQYESFYLLYQGNCEDAIKSYLCKAAFSSCGNDGIIKQACYEDCTNAISGCETNYCSNLACDGATRCGSINNPPGGPNNGPNGNSGDTSVLGAGFAAVVFAVGALFF